MHNLHHKLYVIEGFNGMLYVFSSHCYCHPVIYSLSLFIIYSVNSFIANVICYITIPSLNKILYLVSCVFFVRSLISDGLGLNSEIRSTHRAPSINHDAGVLTINLASPAEKRKVMTNKWKLSNSEKYYHVYKAGGELLVNRRIERKFEMLVNNRHGGRSTPPAIYNRTYYNRNRYRQ